MNQIGPPVIQLDLRDKLVYFFHPARWRLHYRDWRYRRHFRTKLTDEEVWDLHLALAQVISDGILRLRDGIHGHPAHMTQEEWVCALTRIAAGFTRYAADWESDNPEAPVEALDLLKQVWPDLWD